MTTDKPDIEKLLTQARELLEKSTPGRWSATSSLPVYAVSTQGEWGVWDVVTATGREYARHAHHEKHGSRQEDAEFIAFLRNHLGEILELVERQRRALDSIIPSMSVLSEFDRRRGYPTGKEWKEFISEMKNGINQADKILRGET